MSAIYRSEDARRSVEERYRRFLEGWPAPSTHTTVVTREGDTFVVASGPTDVFTDEQLRSLAIPVLVVAGDKDRMLDSHETASRVRRLVPDSVVTLLPGTGHIPTGYAAIVGDFLKGEARDEAQPRTRLSGECRRAARDAPCRPRRCHEGASPDAVTALRTAIPAIDNAGTPSIPSSPKARELHPRAWPSRRSDAVVPVASRGMSLGASGPPAGIRTLVDGCTGVELVSAEGTSARLPVDGRRAAECAIAGETDGVVRALCPSGGRHRVELDHGSVTQR